MLSVHIMAQHLWQQRMDSYLVLPLILCVKLSKDQIIIGTICNFKLKLYSVLFITIDNLHHILCLFRQLFIVLAEKHKIRQVTFAYL